MPPRHTGSGHSAWVDTRAAIADAVAEHLTRRPSEHDHKAAAAAFGLESAMRLRCLFRRERRGDAQRDESSLDLLTQPIQQVRSVVVVAHRRPVKGDPALVTAPAAHGSKTAPSRTAPSAIPLWNEPSARPSTRRGDLPDLRSDVVTRGTTISAPSERTSCRSALDASAITCSPSALASCTTYPP